MFVLNRLLIVCSVWDRSLEPWDLKKTRTRAGAYTVTYQNLGRASAYLIHYESLGRAGGYIVTYESLDVMKQIAK